MWGALWLQSAHRLTDNTSLLIPHTSRFSQFRIFASFVFAFVFQRLSAELDIRLFGLTRRLWFSMSPVNYYQP